MNVLASSGQTMAKTLSINCIVPPLEYGGAERSAVNLALQFAKHGYPAHLLGHSEQSADEIVDGVMVLRRNFRRPYPMFSVGKSAFDKLAWYAVDLFSPANKKTVNKIIDDIDPQIVILHNLQGIGFNIVECLAERNIPTIMILHDLGLVCLNQAMYLNGNACAGWCAPCKGTTWVRSAMMRSIPRLAIVAPSQANLDRVDQYLNLKPYLTRAIPNPNSYPVYPRKGDDGEAIRIAYVGRISPEKGVEFILNVFQELDPALKIVLDLYGEGPQLDQLREKYSKTETVEFHGHVSLNEVGLALARADIAVMPSLWAENFAGVAVHALQAGVPLLASDTGGTKEILGPQLSECLLPAGDKAAWLCAISDLARDKSKQERLSRLSKIRGQTFQPDAIFGQYVDLASELIRMGE